MFPNESINKLRYSVHIFNNYFLYFLHICPKREKKNPSDKDGKLVLIKIRPTRVYRGINGQCNTFQSDNTSSGQLKTGKE